MQWCFEKKNPHSERMLPLLLPGQDQAPQWVPGAALETRVPVPGNWMFLTDEEDEIATKKTEIYIKQLFFG